MKEIVCCAGKIMLIREHWITWRTNNYRATFCITYPTHELVLNPLLRYEIPVTNQLSH